MYMWKKVTNLSNYPHLIKIVVFWVMMPCSDVVGWRW